jgi:cytochrome c oxidase subunit 2
VGKKVRFLLTGNDVIHSWWVPKLGVKKDAIPGFINEAWTRIEEPGVYRGQCAELCGLGHGFMPIVVRAVSPDEYQQWVKQHKQHKQQKVAMAAGAAQGH